MATANQKAAFAGSALLVVGSFLDWATVKSVFGEIGVAGTEGDGKLTLAGGVIIFLLLVNPSRTKATWAVVISLLSLAVSAYDFATVSDKASNLDSDFATASVGMGLWACCAGSVVATLAGFRLRQDLATSTVVQALPGFAPPPPPTTQP